MTTPQISYVQDIIRHPALAEAEERALDPGNPVTWPG